MLAIFASVMVCLAVCLAMWLLFVWMDRDDLKYRLEISLDERRKLQEKLYQQSETLDANAGDMDSMRKKLSDHADAIMQLRVKLGHAHAGFDRLESVRIATIQKLTDTE